MDNNTDVLIVGGGIAGMMVAVRSAQAGRRVRVLERLSEDRYVCNTRLTGGVFHCALNDIRKAPEDLESAIRDAGGGDADPALSHMMAFGAKPAVDWLQSLGVRFIRGADPWQSFVLAPPGIAQLGRQWQGRAGDVLLRTLETQLLKYGGEILRGHEALHLLMQGDRCVGVEARVDGLTRSFASARVVLADGGFQANLEDVGRYVTAQPNKIVQRNAGSGVGAGLRMARAAGAALSSDLSPFYGHVLSRDALSNDQLWPYPWLDELLKYHLVVKQDGRRFADEGLGGVYVANAMARLTAPDGTSVITDAEGWATGGTERFLPPNPNFEKVGATVLQALTVRELAGKAGIDPEGLEAEVQRFNDAIASGTCTTLEPPRSSVKASPRPVRKAPFYALPASAGITYTMGGVLIDASARVLGNDGRSMSGLYAVGSTTGGLEGGPRTAYLGGLVKASTTALACADSIISTWTPR